MEQMKEPYALESSGPAGEGGVPPTACRDSSSRLSGTWCSCGHPDCWTHYMGICGHLCVSACAGEGGTAGSMYFFSHHDEDTRMKI